MFRKNIIFLSTIANMECARGVEDGCKRFCRRDVIHKSDFVRAREKEEGK